MQFINPRRMRSEDYGSQLCLCVCVCVCVCVRVSVTTKRATPLVKISKLVCLPKVNGVCLTFDVWIFLKCFVQKLWRNLLTRNWVGCP